MLGDVSPPPPAGLRSQQLPLPLGPPLASPPMLPRAPEVLPAQQVWRRLTPPTQRSVQQTFVRVLREVLHDGAGAQS
jgi:hypothetical protein